MTTLYEDAHVTLDDTGITIHNYYFPTYAAKRVRYADVRRAEVRTLGPLTGQWRIWGMGLAPYWFHLDAGRPKKTRGIALDLGGVIRPLVTPENVDTVLAIVKGKAHLA